MPCEEPVITPHGRQGIGVNQPQSGLDYPLVAPSDDIRYLIADFYLSYDDPGFYTGAPAYKHPLHIKWLYGVGCEPNASLPGWVPDTVHDADIVVEDADGATVFDSTQLAAADDTEYRRFIKTSWGDDYDIYEWIGTNGVCRLVTYKTWPGEADTTFDIAPRVWPVHIIPTNAALDERAIHRVPKRLRTLRVKVGNTNIGQKIRRRGVIFSANYNMVIAQGDKSGSPVQNTNIVFSAEPGSGAGKYDNCPPADDTTRPIFRINGARANEYGDFLLTATDCLFVRQPTVIRDAQTVEPVRPAGAAALILGSDCGPCCDCPDYAFVANYMNTVAERYKTLGAQTHTVKLLHEENIDRWATQRLCRLQRPLRVQMTPQNCPNIDVLIMYCNQCQQCAEDVTLSVNFSTFPTNAVGTIVCGYTTITAPGLAGVNFNMGGTWPTFTAQLPPIDVGNSAYVKFRLRLSPKTYPYSVNATLTGTNGALAITSGCELGASAASAVAYSALNCTIDGETIDRCY